MFPLLTIFIVHFGKSVQSLEAEITSVFQCSSTPSNARYHILGAVHSRS
jgi:hypothetical protein